MHLHDGEHLAKSADPLNECHQEVNANSHAAELNGESIDIKARASKALPEPVDAEC
jgi:hypothetical protein